MLFVKPTKIVNQLLLMLFMRRPQGWVSFLFKNII